MSYGVVVTHRPIRFMTYVYILISLVIAILAFLAFGQYAIKSEVPFVIRKSGQITYRADREALVEKVLVRPGERFRAGDTLIRLKEDGRAEVVFKLDNLKRQMDEQERIHVKSLLETDAQRQSVQKQIDSLQNDKTLHARNLEILARKKAAASEKLTKVQALVDGKYLTTDARTQAETEAHQAAYDENNAMLLARDVDRRIEELERQLSQLEITKTQAAVSRTNAALKLQHEAEKSHTALEVKAISDGKVANVLVAEGGIVKDAMPLLIASQDDRAAPHVQVTLFADARSIGFLKKGDRVNLRVDAFPYEKYGTLHGEILSVDVTPTEGRALPLTGADIKLAYAVSVRVPAEQSHFKVPGNYLLDGMTGRAAVKLQTLSLVEWLFLPVIKGLNRNPDFGSRDRDT